MEKPKSKPRVRASRNPELVPGIGRYSRSAMYAKRAMFKKKRVIVKKEVKVPEKFKRKEIGGDKNGGSRLVPVKREPRFYPTEDVRRPLANRKKPGKAKLRSSIVPGTVLILLAGHHRGKRVVFLKQLESGLLLITGPFKVNGVPLRRVPQAYVIATSTVIDVSEVTLPERLKDDYFKREPKKKKRSEDMFEDTAEEKKVSEKRIEDQKTVDNQVMPLISNVKNLRRYLGSLFTLRKGQFPHNMKF